MPRYTTRLAAAAGVAAGYLAARKIACTPPDPALERKAHGLEFDGPWRHNYIRVNGVRLHYAEMGEGPLVVLLHGFPECWYEWRHVMRRLSTRFHVVAPDMRGYNRSDKPVGVGNYTLKKLGQDVASLIEALGYDRAHVVGHDWGGVVAWHVGAFHANRVDRLAVINAPHYGAYRREVMRGEQLLRSGYVFFFQLPTLPEAVVRLTLRSTLQATAVVPGAFDDDCLDVYQNSFTQPGAATATINYYRAAARRLDQVVAAGQSTISVPTMLLWGMKDFALSPGLAEGLERWVPNIRVERIEDCGHWVPEEKPTLTAGKLMEFLAAG